MKATQVKASPTPSRKWTCVQCGKVTDKPYSFVRHGEACACCGDCDRAYYRRRYEPMDLLRKDK